MLAASYLPRRWPSKYCHRYESLRPCSGWERVVYSHLATSEFFEYAQNCIKYNIINLTFPLTFKRLCNQRLLRCFAHASQQRRHRSVSSFKSCSSCSVFLRTLTHSGKPLLTSHRLTLFRKSPRPISNA